jgi:hypothetical protein
MQIDFSEKICGPVIITNKSNEKIRMFGLSGFQRKEYPNNWVFYCTAIHVSRNIYLQIKPLLQDRTLNIKCSQKILDKIRIAEEDQKKDIENWERILKVDKNSVSKLEIIKGRFYSNDLFEEFGDTHLLNHQKAGVLMAMESNRFAFFYDTGTGKTAMALEIIKKLKGSRFLIICPKSIIQTAWIADCMTITPNLRLCPLCSGLSYQDRQAIAQNNYKKYYENEVKEPMFAKTTEIVRLMKKLQINFFELYQAQHYITNPEFLLNNTWIFKQFGIDGLIFDESAKLKNYDSLITRCIQKYSEEMKYIYFLSGKPAPNTDAEYFSQMKMIDPYSFDMSFGEFKRKKFVPVTKVNSYKQYLQFREMLNKTDCQSSAEKQFKVTNNDIADLVRRRSFTVSKEECFNLPPKIFQTKYFRLSKNAYIQYKNMEYDYYTIVQNAKKEGKIVSVTNHLACLRKLQQISSGFLKDNEKYDELNKDKLDLLFETIDELPGKQVIIWCQYRYEIDKITQLMKEKQLKFVTAYGGTENVNDSICCFKSGEAQYLIAHPRTLMYGATLTNCSYSIYFSISYSFEEFYQSHDRIYRYGQKTSCIYIFLQAQQTIDQVMYRCVMDKKRSAEIFETLLKDIEGRI